MNIFIFLFVSLLFTFTLNPYTSLHLLLTAEILWITLYALVILLGFTNDNIHSLGLTFFFLIFSATEFSIGLVLVTFQQLIVRSLSLESSEVNMAKFATRVLRRFDVNRVVWSN